MPRFLLDQAAGCQTTEAVVFGRLLTELLDVVNVAGLSAAWPWTFIATAVEVDLSAVNWT